MQAKLSSSTEHTKYTYHNIAAKNFETNPPQVEF